MNGSMIENVPLFAGLSEAQRALIGEHLVRETHKAGDPLYVHGTPATKMYLIKTGWVRLVTDQRITLANVGQGSLLGDGEVLLDQTYSTTAQCTSDVEAWALSSDDLTDIVAAQPEIGLEFSKAVGVTAAPLMRYLVDRRLRTLSGLTRASSDCLSTMASRLCIRALETGEVLWSSGQVASSIYLVEQGHVAVYDGARLVTEYNVGELATESNVLAGRGHATTARAAAPTWLWELTVVDLDKLATMFPDLRSQLTASLRAQLNTADWSRAIELLRAAPLFRSLSPEAIQELAGRLTWQTAPAGKVIFAADTLASSMYLVESGTVELLNQRGEALARITNGGYFGEAGLMGTGAYGIAARARGNVNLWALTAKDVAAVAERFPQVRAILSEQLTEDNAPDEEHFAEHYLRHLPLFAGLNNEQVREVAHQLRLRHLRPSEAVFRQGAAATALYLVQEGNVSVQALSESGDVEVLASVGPGEFFGETALLADEPYNADAFAMSDTAVWALTRQDFESLLVRFPVIALNLSRLLSRRLQEKTSRAPAAPKAAGAPAVKATAPARTPAQPRATAPKTVAPQTVAPTMVDMSAAAPYAAPAPAQGPQPTNRVIAWFVGQSTVGKIRTVALVLLLVWLIGVAAPSFIISLLSGGHSSTQSAQASMLDASAQVALAADGTTEVLATYTPWPTETPLPPTATATPAPTDTPEPTATPTQTNTPVPPTATSIPPTFTPRPVAVVQPTAARAVAAAAAPAPKPAAGPAKKYTLIKFYHLTPCENKGKHVAQVHVVDPAGNPVDGVMLVFRAANFGDIFDVQPSGRKGPGWIEFDLHKDGQYMVYPTADRTNPDNSDVTPPIGTTDDPNGVAWHDEMCGDGLGGNTIGHNSFEIYFQKNY